MDSPRHYLDALLFMVLMSVVVVGAKTAVAAWAEVGVGCTLPATSLATD